ncbi:hypothetical protein Tsubulata_004610 [Turnera subulata]|uniref:Uncharacterized protein n=1 Tax=Turnera subulata TaxID=218843 RepID=A0A9Q0GBT0_9ROSI|nr:hypothetical protein Tsubulata_004610 [Turnera subulata]
MVLVSLTSQDLAYYAKIWCVCTIAFSFPLFLFFPLPLTMVHKSFPLSYLGLHKVSYAATASLGFEALLSFMNPTYRLVPLESSSDSLLLRPPSDMLRTNSTNCRQFSPSNNFLFILRYVKAVNPLPDSALLVAKTCAYPPASYLSNAFSPASSILAVAVAIFTCCTNPSGEQFALSGCSLSRISMQVKLNITPCLLNIRAIGR